MLPFNLLLLLCAQSGVKERLREIGGGGPPMFVQIRIRIQIKSLRLSGFILCHFIDNIMLDRSSYLLLG